MRIPDELKEALVEAAEERGWSVSALVERRMTELMQQEGKLAQPVRMKRRRPKRE